MSGQPVLDMALVPKPQEEGVGTTSQTLALIERLARDPSVDVDKLDRLMQMHERVLAREAESAFNAAMTDAQTKMKRVRADADNPQTRSKYASYAGLDRDLRPIYTDNGFGLSFDTGESPLPEHVRVLCYVSHRAGHSRTYHVDMPSDGKGARGGDVMTKAHAVGAAIAYGMRYLLKMVFNVAVGEDDRDGNDPPSQRQPDEPEGFAAWLAVIQGIADNGLKALEDAWRLSKPEFKNHLFAIDRSGWNDLKKHAAKVVVK